MKRLLLFFPLMLWALTPDPALDQSLMTSVEGTQQSAQSQKKIDAIDAKTQEYFSEYKNYLAQIETMKVYNKQLRALIAEQEKERESLNTQILEIDITAQSIMPLMQKMVNSFKKFIAIDTPFLKKERQERVQKLQFLLANPKLTVSQKYRTIMEAFKIELDFGHTIESYQGRLDDGKEVTFLRIGRIGLYYLTLDQKSLAYYNPLTKKYVALDASSIAALKKAIRISRKELAPDLIVLPMLQAQGGEDE